MAREPKTLPMMPPIAPFKMLWSFCGTVEELVVVVVSAALESIADVLVVIEVIVIFASASSAMG